MTGAIAHVGPNLPQDLLRATGRHAGPLDFDPERATPTADRWMESKFAPWARAILEGWAAGDYDGLGQVLFSRADDSAQRLYYYLCELQRRGLVSGPEALILDIAKVPRGSSVDRTADGLRRMAARLGVDVEEHPDGLTIQPCENIRPAIVQTYNDHRMAMAFALVGLRAPGVTIENPGCVSKTFPNYFEVLDSLR